MKKTFIIAEAGVNHNGSLDNALRLIEIAARSGADAVKFQTFKSEQLVVPEAEKANYQKQTTNPHESQLNMLKSLELDEEAHLELIRHCDRNRVEFMSTPFDLESLDFLTRRCKVKRIKLSSGDLTNGPLLLAAARSGLPLILSTGMATLGEIETALMIVAFGYLHPDGVPAEQALIEAYSSPLGQEVLQQKVSLLHCTTDYPAPLKDVHLRSMDVMAAAFGLSTGYSDHTLGTAIPLAAVARGADIIEKHLTLSRTMPGPDHASSLEPSEFESMIKGIREIETALGRSRKFPAPSEMPNRVSSRKSVVASIDLKPGERFSESNVTVKRPGDGLSALRYWELLGKPADRTYKKNEKIRM